MGHRPVVGIAGFGAVLGVVLGLIYGAENERPAATAGGSAPAAKDDRPVKVAAGSYPSVLIRGVPFIRQKPDFCGEACAAAYLQKLGWRVDQNWVFDQSGLDPREARGCYTKELAAALQKIGFRVGPTWYRISADQAGEQIQRLWKDLYADLSAGVPSIVCTHFDQRPIPASTSAWSSAIWSRATKWSTTSRPRPKGPTGG